MTETEAGSGRFLKNWIKSYIISRAKTEPSGRFHLWTAIMIISVCLGRKCTIQLGPELIFPNFYLIFVGPPASKKSTSIKYGAELLKEVTTIKFAPEAITRQQFFEELEAGSKTIQFSDGSILGYSSILVVAPELSVFMGDKKDLQRIADLCDMYDGRDQFIYKTKHSGCNFIANPSVWLWGATTPAWIEDSMPYLAVGGGLASRVVFVYAPGKAKAISLTDLEPFEPKLESQLIHDLTLIQEMKGSFQITPKGRETFKKWYIEVHPKIMPTDRRLLYFAERMPVMAIKLSMVISASQRDDMVITDQDILWSIRTLNELLPEMPMAFGGMGRNILGKQAQMVREMIKENKEIPKFLIMKTLRNEINEYDYQRIKLSLLGEKFIRLDYREHEEWLILTEGEEKNG